jgi:hypothetical protein
MIAPVRDVLERSRYPEKSGAISLTVGKYE